MKIDGAGTDQRPARSKRKRRLITLVLIGLLGSAAGAVAWRRASGNLGLVAPGVWRSAQLSAPHLATLIRSYGIKTVLNLRGPNPDEAWYRDELRATLTAGAAQIDIPLASDQWLSREQAATLLRVLETCDRPMLVHCEFGAERTGLVSAIVSLAEPHSALPDARRQFSLEYLFVAFKEGRVMQAHLDAYERALARAGTQHSPETFRAWLLAEYRPGSPSREHWPCNPYPLVVIHRPGTTAPRIEWSAQACEKKVAVGDSPATR